MLEVSKGRDSHDRQSSQEKKRKPWNPSPREHILTICPLLSPSPSVLAGGTNQSRFIHMVSSSIIKKNGESNSENPLNYLVCAAWLNTSEMRSFAGIE